MKHNGFSLLAMGGGLFLFGLITTTHFTHEQAMDLSTPIPIIIALGYLGLIVGGYYFYRFYKHYKTTTEKSAYRKQKEVDDGN